MVYHSRLFRDELVDFGFNRSRTETKQEASFPMSLSDPHRTDRYGETWNPIRLKITLEEIGKFRHMVTLSGGWAWHFMTPAGHEELKHAHDHKDIDLFVTPAEVGIFVSLLKSQGYEKTWTRFDRLPTSKDFTRYSKTIKDQESGEPVKVVLDVFVGVVPSIIAQGFRVVEPRTLLSYYGVKHSSDRCFSFQIASKLIAEGVNPNGHPEMANYAPFLEASSGN